VPETILINKRKDMKAFFGVILNIVVPF